MTDPAARFSRAEAARVHPLTTAFADAQRFDLDPFQVAGCHALEEGRSVLVAAPTGAGKTIVGEFAVHLAMLSGADKAFYTTPMKALSNQKFRELQGVYGESAVGLLTGDTNINGNARIVVMTTEVLRNMLYADSPALRDLRYVVMDEVHYLADRFRGAVWEEVIIHLPPEVRLISLSATVSNAEEFGDWLDTVRGDTEVIVSETRPVPLEQHVLVRGDLLPLFDDRAGIATAQVNQELMRIRSFKGPTYENNRRVQEMRASGGYDAARRRPHKGGRRPVRSANVQRIERLDRPEVVELLRRANLLPAIFFIFSRAGCDGAVQQVRRSGLRLTSREERDEIRQIVDERTRTLHDEDLAVLGFWDWRENLERGVAAHHAGLLPAFKEIVEELFQRKLVKAVFATETLALGINMPARTVVLEKMEKFNGEARVAITAGEYTQLTGRAGRRGIDVEGHAVIQWTEGLDPQAVAALASRRTYPLNSSFRPTYN
ncbi:MAG: DEAD/DEAH box helicase, partial [Microbacterium sp.]